MKARIPGLNQRGNRLRPDLKYIRETIQEEIDTVRVEERADTTRKIIKLMCYLLHTEYGFGKQRCSTVAMGITDIIEKGLQRYDGDTGDFWYSIDRELSFMGPEFYPTEDDIARSIIKNENKN